MAKVNLETQLQPHQFVQKENLLGGSMMVHLSESHVIKDLTVN